MSYGRARYWFYDLLTDPVTLGNTKTGIDLEEVVCFYPVWTKEDKIADCKITEYKVVLKNAQTISFGIHTGPIMYTAWREYCQAKIV